MMQIQEYFNSLFSTYSWVYLFLTILFIVFKFFPTKYKSEGFNGLYCINTLIAWFYLVALIYFIIELFIAWYGQNSYELYAVFELKNVDNKLLFFIKLAFPLLIGLLFFIRKLRKNILLTLIFLVITYREKIVILIINFYRDFIPSTWLQANSFSYSVILIELITIVLFLILIYVTANKKGKLPYPSLFLK